MHYKVEELKAMIFPVSRLDLKFINHQTRESSLRNGIGKDIKEGIIKNKAEWPENWN
jgi:hypothetical protein